MWKITLAADWERIVTACNDRGMGMDLKEIVSYARWIEAVVDGTSWQLDDIVKAIVETENWDLAGRLMVSGSEIAARQLAQKLFEREVWEPLVIAACLRRQPRRPGEGSSGGGVSRNVFRDIDAEDGAKGVPEHIRAEIEEMSKGADQTRASAMTRDAMMDRDAIRQYIVDNISPRMPHSAGAMDAMVAIARASAWDETRRTAALKVANEPISVARLCRELRTDDILEICRMALLTQVAETFAREMGKSFQAYADAKDAAALDFIAAKHPDDRFKDSAKQWAEAVRRGAE